MSTPDPAPETGTAAREATPPRIHLSEPALEKIREMLEEEGLVEEGGLRISAHFGAGCSAPLKFDMTMEHEPARGDVVLSGAGIRLFLNPRDAWSLDGLRVDYVSSPAMGEGFAFQHPRGAGGRAC